jgi:hypothetical protein
VDKFFLYFVHKLPLPERKYGAVEEANQVMMDQPVSAWCTQMSTLSTVEG